MAFAFYRGRRRVRRILRRRRRGFRIRRRRRLRRIGYRM